MCPLSYLLIRNFTSGYFSNSYHCLLEKKVQWGSEYLTSLVIKWLKVVRWPNGQLFECHLNTGLNLVWYSDRRLNTGPVFKWWS